MKRTQGFTLVELLVAMSIMLILLTAMASMMRTTTQAYQTENETTNARQNQESAQEVLTYEISLAGYRGTLRTDYDASASVATDPFTITPNTTGGSDQISIKYFENHVYGTEAKAVKTVILSINTQTNMLLRSQNGATAQPVAANVKRLKVARYLIAGTTTTDCASACTAKPPTGTTGVVLSVTFTDNSVKRIPISFTNPVSV